MRGPFTLCKHRCVDHIMFGRIPEPVSGSLIRRNNNMVKIVSRTNGFNV